MDVVREEQKVGARGEDAGDRVRWRLLIGSGDP